MPVEETAKPQRERGRLLLFTWREYEQADTMKDDMEDALVYLNYLQEISQTYKHNPDWPFDAKRIAEMIVDGQALVEKTSVILDQWEAEELAHAESDYWKSR